MELKEFNERINKLVSEGKLSPEDASTIKMMAAQLVETAYEKGYRECEAQYEYESSIGEDEDIEEEIEEYMDRYASNDYDWGDPIE